MNWKALFRNVLFAVIFSSGVLSAMAQHIHFIYIQASNKKPFYVTLNNRNFSSSADGYLIIPKLTDGQYELQLGFPQGGLPEQKFTIKVTNRDDGYSLRDLGEKGWALSNLKTKETILSGTSPVNTGSQAETASTEPSKEETPVVTTKEKNTSAPTLTNVSSPFGDMLSQVVDDPELTKEVVVNRPKKEKTSKKEKSQKEEKSVALFSTTDTESNVFNNIPAEPAADTTAKSPETAANPYDSYDAARTKGVIKISENPTDKGTDLVFIDFNSTSQDTIHLFIPLSDSAIDDSQTTETSTGKNDSTEKELAKAKVDSAASIIDSTALAASAGKTDTIPAETQTAKAEKKTSSGTYQPYSPNEKPFISFPPKADTTTVLKGEKKEISNPFFNKSTASDSGQTVTPSSTAPKTESNPEQPVVSTATVATATDKGDCKKTVSDEDLGKWKKKMISANSDGDMIKVVNKLMPGKCLSTDQVKSLSGLFLSDDGRYQFFDAAYAYTYDKSNYPALEAQLFDSQYKKRFKAILHN